MNTLTITRDIKYKDGSSNPLVVVVDDEGCEVRYLTIVVELSREQMADVEQLAEIFGDMPVRVFKVVVDVLGMCYNMQDQLTDLLNT